MVPPDSDIEIDVKISDPPPPQRKVRGPFDPPSLVPPPPQKPVAAPRSQGNSQASPVPSNELESLLRQIERGDAPRWMVQKNGMDHGPFSGRELVQLVGTGGVLGEHGLLNMDNGQRTLVRDHNQFGPFALQFARKKAVLDERDALTASSKQESRSNAVKFGVGALCLLVATIAVVRFVQSRSAEAERQEHNASLADLYERGQIQLEASAGILDDHPRRGGGGGARRSSGAGGGGGGSYEEAMNQVVNLGDVSQGGGDLSRLTPQQVQGTVNGRINSFFPCVSAEIRRGGQLGMVEVDLAIAGSGQVLGASVRSGSGEFQHCLEAKVRQMHFPNFGAPRMGARFRFNANQ